MSDGAALTISLAELAANAERLRNFNVVQNRITPAPLDASPGGPANPNTMDPNVYPAGGPMPAGQKVELPTRVGPSSTLDALPMTIDPRVAADRWSPK